MTRSSQSLTLLTVLAVSAMTFACSGAPTDEPTAGVSDEAVTCQSVGGIHIEGCPIPPTGPITPAQVPACTNEPAGTAYDPLFIVDVEDDQSSTRLDARFPALLRQYGCSTERHYTPQRYSSFATATCPASIVPAINAYGPDPSWDATLVQESWGVIPADGCTGAPGAGNVVVAWLTGASDLASCTYINGIVQCSKPGGGGCTQVKCISQ